MKGVVFTELIEMVEKEFSEELADEIIDSTELPSGGAYTAVGTYDHREIISLVGTLSEKTEIPVPDLVTTFGRYLFTRFVQLYPAFFDGAENSFQFLSSIEDYVHTEVRKLYPDAELPSFDCTMSDDRTMVMTYSSTRPFADLARGLIEGCVAHFGEDIEIGSEDLSGDGTTQVRFTLSRQA